MTPNELVLTFRGSYVCANFGENRSRNATVRVSTDGQTHTHTHKQTDANRFYNLSHAICYSYGTDKYLLFCIFTVWCCTGLFDVQDSYVMKLFDRSVDLAQFSHDTPLYPVCRAWIRNLSQLPATTEQPQSNEPLDESQVNL